MIRLSYLMLPRPEPLGQGCFLRVGLAFRPILRKKLRCSTKLVISY